MIIVWRRIYGGPWCCPHRSGSCALSWADSAHRSFMLVGTLNRTLRSYVTAIIGAEYVLGWLLRGTHDWHKFVRPAELNFTLKHYGFEIAESCGVAFNPLTMRWS